jgi:2Fe-2S ferredoxin
MSGVFKITFLPENKGGEISGGETVLEAAERLGVVLNHECGGVASCSTCRVRITDGSGRAPVLSEMDVDEREVLEREQLDGDYRLACQTRVRGDVTVLIPPPVKPLADQALPASR